MKLYKLISLLAACLLYFYSCEYERVNPFDEESSYYTTETLDSARFERSDLIINFTVSTQEDIADAGIRFYIVDPYYNNPEEKITNENFGNHFHSRIIDQRGISRGNGKYEATLEHIPPGTEIYYQTYVDFEEDGIKEFFGELEVITNDNYNVDIEPINMVIDQDTGNHNNLTVIKDELYYLKEDIETDEYGYNVTSRMLLIYKHDTLNNTWNRITSSSSNYFMERYIVADNYILVFYSRTVDYNIQYYYNYYSLRTRRWSSFSYLPSDLSNLFQWYETLEHVSFTFDNTIYVRNDNNELSAFNPTNNWFGSSIEASAAEVFLEAKRENTLVVNSRLFTYTITDEEMSETGWDAPVFTLYSWDINAESMPQVEDEQWYISKAMRINDELYLVRSYTVFRPRYYNYYKNTKIVFDHYYTDDNFENDSQLDFDMEGLFRYDLETETISNSPLLSKMKNYSESTGKKMYYESLFENNSEFIGTDHTNSIFINSECSVWTEERDEWGGSYYNLDYTYDTWFRFRLTNLN